MKCFERNTPTILFFWIGIRPEEKLGPGPRKWRNFRENNREWQKITKMTANDENFLKSDRNLCVSQAKFDVSQALQFILGPDQHMSVI